MTFLYCSPPETPLLESLVPSLRSVAKVHALRTNISALQISKSPKPPLYEVVYIFSYQISTDFSAHLTADTHLHTVYTIPAVPPATRLGRAPISLSIRVHFALFSHAPGLTEIAKSMGNAWYFELSCFAFMSCLILDPTVSLSENLDSTVTSSGFGGRGVCPCLSRDDC